MRSCVATAELLCLCQDMGGEEDRAPGASLLMNGIKRRPLVDGIHSGGGFVEKHERLVHHEDLGGLHATLQAAARINDLLTAIFREAELIRDPLDTGRNLRPGERVKSCIGVQVVDHGEIEFHCVFLKNHAKVPVNLDGVPENMKTEHVHFTARRRCECCENPKENQGIRPVLGRCGLAGNAAIPAEIRHICNIICDKSY
jgi:hypothetical protein